MASRLWLGALLLMVTACGSDRVVPDGGARPDAGFFVPADVGQRDRGVDGGAVIRDADPADALAEDAPGLEDAAPINADAAPINADAAPTNADAAPTNADAAMVNADAAAQPDAAMTNPDAAAQPDAAVINPDAAAQPDAAVINPDAAVGLDAAPGGDAGVINQAGGLLISEFLARSATLEWIEVTNTTGAPVNLANYVLSTQAHANLVLRATTDPTGAMGTAITLAAGASMVGVANPSGASVPPVARFLIGTPGQLGANWIGDTGDVLTLRSPANAGDVVDFRAAATNPANAVGASEFPLVDEVSTQLDPPVVGPGGELGNDNGAVWCAHVFRGATPNAANRSCTAFVVSELTYDYAQPSSGSDDGYEFIELAGPAGGSLAGVFVAFVDGATRNTNGTPIAITGARMPLDGLYVVADRSLNVTTSFVANADQTESIGVGTNSALQNGPDAVQLYRVNADASFTLLDALGYGALTGATDTARGLAFYEGTPVTDVTTTAYACNFARADDEADTNANSADFTYAPTATPGVRNGSSAMVLSSIVPNNAIVGTSLAAVLSGTHFTDGMTVTFAQAPAPTLTNQAVTTPNVLTVQIGYPGGGPTTAQRVDVTLAGRVEFGRSVTVTGGFTWTTANNETNAAGECDFCNLQFPTTLAVAPGAMTPLVFGRIFEAGRTDTTVGSAAPNVLAELGFGPTATDPRTVNWAWTRASFNVEVGNDDEYQARFTAPAIAGTYAYTYRFSLDGGLTWTYADTDGAGSNATLTFASAQVGVLTVQ